MLVKITDVTQSPYFSALIILARMKLAQYGDLTHYLSRIPYLHTGYDSYGYFVFSIGEKTIFTQHYIKQTKEAVKAFNNNL